MKKLTRNARFALFIVTLILAACLERSLTLYTIFLNNRLAVPTPEITRESWCPSPQQRHP